VLPIAQEVIAAVASARGLVVKLPTMGGSVPLEVIEQALDTHTITVPIANYDNNQSAGRGKAIDVQRRLIQQCE
jgi:hypothetical protein